MSYSIARVAQITRPAILAFAASSLLFILPSAAFADDAEAPVVLSSKHIGMSADAIAEDAQADQEVAVAEVADSPNEWNDDDVREIECPIDDAIRTEGAVADSYEHCLEVAIRSGQGFSSSSGVCRALFPLDQQAKTGSEQTAPTNNTLEAVPGPPTTY